MSAEGITLTEIGVYLSINVAFLAAVWILVRGSAQQILHQLGTHTAEQEVTLSSLRSDVRQTDACVDNLLGRVSAIETRQSSMPSHEEIYRLGLGVERLIARLDAQDAIIARIDTIVQRQDDYLISRNR